MIEFFSPAKLVLIALVAIIALGPKRLPAVGRWVGKTLKEFQRGATGLGEELKAGLTTSDATENTKG